MELILIDYFKATYIDNDAVSNANLLGERFRTTYDKAARYDNVGNWFLAKKGSALSNAANGGVTWNHQVLLNPASFGIKTPLLCYPRFYDIFLVRLIRKIIDKFLV